jgi:hypothetical protein
MILIHFSKFKIDPIIMEQYLLFQSGHGSLLIREMNLNNFIWMDAPNKPLSNSENRSSLSFSYQKLFKKCPRPLMSEMDISY